MTDLLPGLTLADRVRCRSCVYQRIRNLHVAKSQKGVVDQPLALAAAVVADLFSWLLMSDLMKCRLFVLPKVKGHRRYL